MRLNYQDSLVIEDAARLLKSHFVELYTKLGYERDQVGVAWHELRVTDRGRNLMIKYSNGGGQPTRFYDIDEEVKQRKSNMKSSQLTNKPVKKVAPVEDEEPEYLSSRSTEEDEGEESGQMSDQPDGGFPGEPVVETSSRGRKKDGSKEETAKSLIESGIVKAKELAEKGGFSLPYAYNMLKKYGRQKEKAN